MPRWSGRATRTRWRPKKPLERGFVWIPPEHPVWKVYVGNSDDDVTDNIEECSYTLTATEGAPNFSITLVHNGAYTNRWSEGESAKIYVDRKNGKTLRINGTIDNVEYIQSGGTYKVKIKGRSKSAELLDIVVTKSYSETYTKTILQDLFSSYSSDLSQTYDTSTYVEGGDTNDTKIDINWYQKTFWDCLRDLCKSANFSLYIDAQMKVHYFPKNSKHNQNEAIVHDQNLLSSSGIAKDTSTIKNRIIVTSSVEDMPIVAKAEDLESQSKYGVKIAIISDDNITTIEQAQDRANAELQLLKNPKQTGTLEALGMPDLMPGESLMISDPINNLSGWYAVLEIENRIASDKGMTTKVTIAEIKSDIPALFKQTTSDVEDISKTDNPYDMTHSYVFTFEDDNLTELHTNTVIQDSKLIVDRETGYVPGKWTSKPKVVDFNITSVQVKASGNNITDVQFEVSADGSTWETVPLNTLHTLSSSGKYLRLRIQINSVSTEIESACVLFK